MCTTPSSFADVALLARRATSAAGAVLLRIPIEVTASDGESLADGLLDQLLSLVSIAPVGEPFPLAPVGLEGVGLRLSNVWGFVVFGPGVGEAEEVADVLRSLSRIAFGSSALWAEGALSDELVAEYARFFDLTPALHLITDMDRNILVMNQSWQDVLGYSVAELREVGVMHLLQLLHPEDIDRTAQMGQQIRQGHRVLAFENRFRHKDGSYRWLRWAITPSLDRERIYSEARDVTNEHEEWAELRDASAFVHTILEGIPVPVFVKDEEHRWLAMNKSFCDFVGHQRSALLGKSDFEFFPREEAEVYWQRDDEVFRTGHNVNEEALTNSEGEERWILTRKRAMTLPDGRRVLVGVITDITARRQVELDLARSELRHRVLVDAVPDMMFRVNEHGIILDYKEDDRVQPFVKPVELIGAAIDQKGLPPAIGDRALELIRTTIATGQRQLWEYELPGPPSPSQYEARFAKVEPDEAVIIIRDITARRQAEDALRLSEERLRLAVQAARMCTWNWEVGSGTIDWVGDVGEVIGVDTKTFEPTLSGYLENVHPDDREQFGRELLEAVESGNEFRVSNRVVDADGLARWLIVQGSVFVDSAGEIERLAGTVWDETAQKTTQQQLVEAREAALEASRTKSQFLANMSHEIRTPMNGVMGMTSLLLETPLSPPQRDYVEAIRSSSDTLLTIINDILDFSKVEAGKLDVEAIDFCLPEVVEDVVDMFGGAAQQKGIELVCIPAPSVPEIVIGDPTRLRQVLTNLVSNAIKFTERGHVAVRVSAEYEESTALVHLLVEDTGVGIPETKHESVYESFSQADGTTTRRFGGTGLGLAISRDLVHLMGGQLSFESTVGVGSTFSVSLRLAVRTHKTRSYDGVKTGGTSRVLVVEPHPIAREALTTILESMGIVVAAVDTMKVARALLKKEPHEPFGAAVVASALPDGEGVKLARWLQEMPGYRRLPIMLTAERSDYSAASQVKVLRRASLLPKPIRRSLLLRKLASAWGVRSQDIEVEELSYQTGQFPLEKVNRQRVLIAEDNPVNQRVAVRLLERFGYLAEVVADGEAAVQAVERGGYAGVLMDCQMPIVDGFEATTRIRQLPAPKCDIPIIAMTANAMRGDRERCLAAGMNDYLSKPVEVERLRQVLESWLSPSGVG